MSQFAGESFAYSGSVVAARQAATISAADSGASSTFGHERLSSIVTSSSRAHVSAYSCGREAADGDPERQPELAQTRQRLGEEAVAPRVGEPDRVQHPDVGLGDPDGRVPAARQRRHGLRHEGVELPRRLGRGQRVEAAAGVKQHGRHRPFHAEALPLAADLDRAAVAGAVAAGHRGFPGELGGRAQALGPLPASAPARRRARRDRLSLSLSACGDQDRVDDHLGVRDERSSLRMPFRAEAQDRRRPVELRRQVRQRRDPDPAPDEQRPLDVEAEAVPERAEDVERVAGSEGAQRLRSRARSGRSGTRAPREARGRGSSAAAAAVPAPRA